MLRRHTDFGQGVAFPSFLLKLKFSSSDAFERPIQGPNPNNRSNDIFIASGLHARTTVHV